MIALRSSPGSLDTQHALVTSQSATLVRLIVRVVASALEHLAWRGTWSAEQQASGAFAAEYGQLVAAVLDTTRPVPWILPN